MLLDESALLKRFKDIKLVVSDVDGTLLNNENELSPATAEIIRKLKSKGILFTLATQRVYSSLEKIISDLDINIPVISLNGAFVSSVNGDILNRSLIKPYQVRKALMLADKSFVRVALCSDNVIVYTENNSFMRDFIQRVGTTYTLVDSYDPYIDKTLEIILMGNEKVEVKKISKKMKFPYTLGLKVKYFRAYSDRGIYNLEILKKGINKKTGLKHLVKHLGIKKSQVMVMGDWYNDKDLFEFGGLNIALKNAVASLKEKANFITERTNDEEGVAHFLQNFHENI